MLKLRVIAALAAWGFLMMHSSNAGAYEWVFAAMGGFVLSVLPVGWFVPLGIGQVLIAGAIVVAVPAVRKELDWIAYLFFALNLALNALLYAQKVQEGRSGPSSGAPPGSPSDPAR